MGLPVLGPPWQIGFIDVSQDQWLAAAVIAGLRMQSNAGRVARRSRGEDKNVLNDIQGVIGELVAIKALEARQRSDRVRHAIFDWDGGTGRVQDAVDVLVDVPGYGTLRFESKCHLDADRKRMLLVNRTAHERSKRRGADGYIPIVGVLGREQACVGHLIAHEELDRWPPKTYRYGDPALGRPLVDVSTQLFGMSWPALQRSMRSADEVASEGTLRRVALGAARRFDELRTGGFDLSGLPHEQLVATARGEARACWVAGA